MDFLESWQQSTREEPTEGDTERYYRYIDRGVPLSAIYPMPPDTLVRVENDRLPDQLRGSAELQEMRQELRDEVSSYIHWRYIILICVFV